jgi:hypothetical protein
MRLDPFITDLLYEHDCVILPDLGGLVANYRSARLNVISHVIQPPCKSIGFNPSLKYNDGLLTNYISAVLGISYKEAAEQLSQTIAEYHQALMSDGRFSIDRVGIFYKDRFGQVQFIPEEQENFLLSSYGLKPIQLKLAGNSENKEDGKVIPIDKTKTLRWKVAAAIILPALLAGSWMLGSRVNGHDEMSFASINPFKEPKKQSAFAPAASDWDLSMNFPQTDYSRLLNDSVASMVNFVSGTTDARGIVVEPPMIQLPVEPQPVNDHQSEPVVERKNSNKKFTSDDSNSTSAYTLIGGAFRVKENALRLIQQLKSQGYDAQLAGMKEDMYLVAYGHFASRRDAETMKTKVQSAGGSVWIRTNQ